MWMNLRPYISNYTSRWINCIRGSEGLAVYTKEGIGFMQVGAEGEIPAIAIKIGDVRLVGVYVHPNHRLTESEVQTTIKFY